MQKTINSVLGSSRANSYRINHSSKCLPRHELGTTRIPVSHRSLCSLGSGSDSRWPVDLQLELVLDYARRLWRAYHADSDVPVSGPVTPIRRNPNRRGPWQPLPESRGPERRQVWSFC